ncbi:AAA family ATPase [Nocardioides yefusunii]|uniref:CpaE family protein n=1 Tax=Nocardioides yefusunii TaxID=2500546 RepID=A0ABW1QUL1_9ACTN|nr:ParA family protein [Nocardioides yefusunii]
MTTNTAPIGLVGLPGLLEPFSQIGLTPIHNEHPPTAVVAIQQALETASFPVLLHEETIPRIIAWLPALAHTAHVVIVSTDPSRVELPEGITAQVADIPTSLGELLTISGYSGFPPEISEIAIGPDGHVWTEATQTPTPPDADPAPTQLQVDHSTPASEQVVPPEPQEPPAAVRSPVTHAPAPAVVDDTSARRVRTSWPDESALLAYAHEMSGPGTVIVLWSAKGGVGKTTASMSLAQLLGSSGGSTLLVDANIGQGDIRSATRVGEGSLPSAYQAAYSEDPGMGVVSASRLNASRSLKLEPLKFAAVLAPSDLVPDPDLVGPETYRSIIAHARANYDYVVIDTQITESLDRNNMVGHFILPLLLTTNSYGLALTDPSPQAIDNLLSRLKFFAGQGVPEQRQLFLMNRVQSCSTKDVPGMVGAISQWAQHVGTIEEKANIAGTVHQGRPADRVQEFGNPLREVALSISGDAVAFAPLGGDTQAPPSMLDPKEPKKSKKPKPPKKGADLFADADQVGASEPAKSATGKVTMTSDSVFLRLFRR